MHHPHRDRRRLLKLAALAPAWAASTRLTSAAAESSAAFKSLQLIVPVPPGAQPDVIARWLIEPLARRAGVPGLVVNRPGAAGALAADAVLAAAPNSGTLLLGGLDHVAYSHLNSNRRALDPFTDFVPVGSVNRDTWVVATATEGPARSLADLAERSRREPLSYASLGEGSTAHLLSARLSAAAGITAQHVPYRDPWMPDLLAGRIHFVVAPTPAVLQQARGGRLRILATLTPERLPLPGDPPSVGELGLASQVFFGGLFLFAPAALAPQASRLNIWLVESLQEPETAQRFRDVSILPAPAGLEATAEMVRQRLAQVDAMRLAVFGRTR
jgi:tripartite-type tricarboxylate transporter receptor subunit TctC